MDLIRLAKAMGDLNESEVIAIITRFMAQADGRVLEVLDAFKDGMDIVSERFDACEYFIGDLIYAGLLMTQAESILRPAIRRIAGEKAIGKVIVCTVYGDLHDIGKNIVKAVLEARGVSVIDLGVDVTPMEIEEVVESEDIKVIALSGVMSDARVSMRQIVKHFIEKGIRDNVKIIIGGACVDETAFAIIGANAWAVKPFDGADICCAWLAEEAEGQKTHDTIITQGY